MLYLLDANVLIDASRNYYPLDRVPEFWTWLEMRADEGSLKVPQAIYEEVSQGTDLLARWMRDESVRSVLLLIEDAAMDLVAEVVDRGYAPDLRDDEVSSLGRDPFLIAHALLDPERRVVVTSEVSRPRARRGNRHIPDVCSDLGIRSINTFRLIRDLDFNTTH